MKFRTVVRGALLLLAILSSASAHALLFRAYLSLEGSDSNPCTLQLPCRLLPAALNAVTSGGEIWMLDSANYNSGSVTVTKSVSILAVPGAVGSLVTSGGPALSIINPGLTVSLRNLVIVPLAGAAGSDGIQMTANSKLTIEHSLFANLQASGVSVAGPGKLMISNTILRNNGTVAVALLNGATADISSTYMLGNTSGGVAAISTGGASTTATVSDSIISGARASELGVSAQAIDSGSTTRIFVTRCTIQGTSIALDSSSFTVGAPTLVVVSASTIVNNVSAFQAVGADAVVRTLGNNHITNNDGSLGSLTPTPLQ